MHALCANEARPCGISNCALAVLFPLAVLLAGCTGMPGITTTATESNPVQGQPLQGRVHGGQNPLVGAHVYLYLASSMGYGEAPTSLLKSAANTFMDGSGNYYVKTDGSGDFSITGDYTCPTATADTYVLALQGDPGTGNNPVASLVAGVDSCNTSQFVWVNEVSTIAVAYAFAGFITDSTHVGMSGTALAQTGFSNARDTLSNLYTQTTGVALATTPNGNGTVPQMEINTLANILAACINSTGTVTGPTNPTPCYTLFYNAENGSTPAPDTATAAIDIARNPGLNITNLFSLQPGTGAPFQPALPSRPNDFTIAISFTGGLTNPDGITVDKSGNVWVASVGSTGTVTEFSHLGVPTSVTGGGMSGPEGVAFDGSGNAWVANSNNTLSEFTSTGAVISTTAYSGGGLSSIDNLVIDKSGNVWASNLGNNSVSKFNSGGMAVSGSSGYTGGGQLNGPTGLAIDTAGNIWIGNNTQTDTGNSISELSTSDGSLLSTTAFTGGGLDQPQAIAFDVAGNLWTANSINPGSLSKFTSAGAAVSGSPFSGGGLKSPIGLVIDGSGNLWAANYDGNGISEFNSSGTALSPASTGYEGGGLVGPGLLAIDPSGNVWVGNPDPGNTVVEFVGAATPVVTPIVANLLAPYGAHAVNKP